MHVRQRIGVLIARATTEFIIAGVMNSGNDIDPVAEREAQLQRREDYNSASSSTGKIFASSGATASEITAVPFLTGRRERGWPAGLF